MTRREDDRKLWRAVARTVTRPVKRQDGTRPTPDLAAEMQRLMGSGSDPTHAAAHATGHATGAGKPKGHRILQPAAAAFPKSKSNSLPVQHPIEERVLKRLAKGRQNVDARIDLHGYTQDRARAVLLEFLQNSRAQGHRLVLVITGKGNENQGVLRRNVPLWLDTSPFAQHINGRRIAHISHGGAGALYVRLRKFS